MMNKEILRLAIPNIISNISIPLLGMVDLAILGHLESEKYIGAVALGGIIFNFIYWGFGFLRMGTSGFTAQAFGKDNSQESILILSRSFLLAVIAGIFIILIQKPIGIFSFWLLDGSEAVENLASEYFYIRIFAAPATIALYSITGWFIGMQDAKTPMFLAILSNGLNLMFNAVFVFYFGMKSEGVAYGTLIAQYIGLIVAVSIFLKKHVKLLKYWNYQLMMNIAEFRKFLLVNKDILIRTLCLIAVFTFFTDSSASESDTLLAVNTLLLQFLLFFSYFIDGFAYAAEALVGKYLGGKKVTLLKLAVKKLFIWGAAISFPFTLFYLFAGKEIMYILTDNEEIIKLSAEYLVWINLVPMLSFAAFLWDGIYIGATSSKAMRNSMLISTFVIFYPVYYLFKNYIDNHALWLAMILFMLFRGLILWLFAKRSIYQL